MAKRSHKKTENQADVTMIDAADASVSRMAQWFSCECFLGLILLLAVIATYSPFWWAGYIWDDDIVVTANPIIVGPLGLKEIWTTSAADICPLTLTTFWLEHALWGLAPLPYHLVNVVMHAASAVLLWRILQNLQVPGAWLGAALWALHPVQVESVAWISEMKNTESGLFFLLSILYFVHWLNKRDRDRNNRTVGLYALSLFFAVLAMSSKSSTVILPVILCLFVWWKESRRHWRSLIMVAPFFLVSVIAAVASIVTQRLLLANANDSQWTATWAARLASAGNATWFYLWKLLWPYPLIAIYPRWEIDPDQWTSYLPLMAMVMISLILWFYRASWSRPYFLSLGFFLAALLPVLGLVNMSFLHYSQVADHFQYLASMGPLALAGAGLFSLADRIIPRPKWFASILGMGMLLTLGLVSWQRAWVFQNEEALWTDTLLKNPNCWLGYNNLGWALFNQGRVDQAIDLFRKSLAINPAYAEAHNNLGAALSTESRQTEAMAEYREAFRIKPDYAQAHYNLGVSLDATKQVKEAVSEYQKAVEIRPDYAEAHYNLANSLVNLGQADAAIAEYQTALKIDPDYVEAHNNLGIALLQKGLTDAAVIQFQEVVRLEPQNSQAQSNLAKVKSLVLQKIIQK